MKKYNVMFCYPTYYYTTVEAEDEEEAYSEAFDNMCSSDSKEWEFGEDYLDYQIEEV